MSEIGHLSVKAAEVRSHLVARRRAFEGSGKGTKFVARDGGGGCNKVTVADEGPTWWRRLWAGWFAGGVGHATGASIGKRAGARAGAVPPAQKSFSRYDRALRGRARRSWRAAAGELARPRLSRSRVVFCVCGVAHLKFTSRFLNEFPRDGWPPMGFAYSRQTALCHGERKGVSGARARRGDTAEDVDDVDDARRM